MEILQAPHPFLRQVSTPVSKFDKDIKKKAQILSELMIKHRGAGLASTQVGWKESLFCAKIDKEIRIFINPRIKSASGMQTDEEGCLSLPGLIVPVSRNKIIWLDWQDINGKPQSGRFDGMPARICQHEIDHLFGITLIDYLPGGVLFIK